MLQEVEADETECCRTGAAAAGSGSAAASRCYSSNRRRGGSRRDGAVSERHTRGGSLQNLVHATSAEFDAGFGRRKAKQRVSVSARQREGGSLPSNVNGGGTGMLTLGGLEYAPQFDDVRLCKHISSGKKKEFVHTSSSSDFSITSSMPVHSPTNVGTTPSDSSGPNNNCAGSKSDCMVIELGDFGENGGEKKGGCGDPSEGLSKECIGNYKASANVDCTTRGGDDEGTELEVMQRSEMTCVPKYTSQATFEVGGKNVSSHDADIDAPVNFSVGILQVCLLHI